MGRGYAYQAYLNGLKAKRAAFVRSLETHHMGKPKVVATQTPYAKKMDALSRRIFSNYPQGLSQEGLKPGLHFEELPVEQNERTNTKYYLPHPMFHYTFALLRNFGLFRDEHKDFNEEMDRLRRLRGKGGYHLRLIAKLQSEWQAKQGKNKS